MDFLLALVLGSSLYLQAAAEFDVRWPRQIVSSIGLCRYGGRIDCCWGWARRSWGQCQPFYVLRQRIARIRCQLKAVCRPQCKHGECIGPDKCKCHPGYAGKTCSQDLNECGLKPRPCKHRCMNTQGSYKCYCLSGYMLMPDGSCSSALTCSMANCQYGCDVVKGQIRCQCPSPGLQLAPDGRTCVDVDECATGSASCPRFRQCVNTFGSYICKCQKGFDLMYIGGKYQCHDIDECSLGQNHCSRFARCYNVHGSYKCKCKDGYKGDGLNCVYIPKVMIEPSGPIHVPKGNGTISKGDGGHSNWIPDVGSTRWPLKTPYIPPVITNRPTSKPTTRPAPRPTAELTPPPFTELGTSPPTTSPESPSTRLTPATPIATTSPRWITVDNRIQTDPQKPRGDVFIPRQPSNDLFEIFEIERGVSADDEAKDDPGVLIHSCNFDHGLCGWIREKDSDLHWEPVRDPTGGQYLTVSGAKGPGGKAARLVLPLGHLMHSGDLCLSFRHKVTGLRSGALQVFVRKHSAHGAALWGRNGGHGWRHTQITLRGADVKSVIFRGEKRRGHTGEIGLDDVSLRKGHCSEEREQHPN
ncbi:nephronectin isoform X3 [Mirounga angustirostris]|uniref:nephronectin isoform X3 n=1 Tax=Mirounga leonina TaxID=9715 RepID=UPI00156C1236|nr:nephronectin isoform X3 [Mirounga leonina]XP_045736591.1 nephronectin isoform X3 [Mirounga angustirostris]